MSNVNEKLYGQLTVDGFEVQKVNTSPKTLNRNFVNLLSRLIPFLRGWLLISFRLTKIDTLYLTPSAGFGQIYDVITILIAKLKGTRKLFIHHHSIKYLEQPNFINHIFFSLTKNTSIHIALCKEMAKKLQATHQCQHIFVLSNFSVLFRHNSCKKEKSKKQNNNFKIGYLSNITKEKGGWLIIDLAKNIQKKHLAVKVIIAGPCHDPDLESELKTSQQQGLLTWLGPVYEEEKLRFFDSIDIFVFPTQNEAEPLVIWEAISHQIPVISYNRGCIGNQVQNAGHVFTPEQNFTNQTVQILETWINDPLIFQDFVQKVAIQHANMQEKANHQWEGLVTALRYE